MNLIATIRRTILKTFTPFLQWFGQIQVPTTKMPDGVFEILNEMLINGDVLLSHKEWNATNLTIPGFWKHAAIYKDGNIIEAVGSGVRTESLAKWLYTKDFVAVLRPNFCDMITMQAAAELAASQIGKPYDFEFSPGLQSFYCSELVFWSYDEAMGNGSPFTLRKTLGVDTVAPQDFVNAVESGKFRQIFMFKELLKWEKL